MSLSIGLATGRSEFFFSITRCLGFTRMCGLGDGPWAGLGIGLGSGMRMGLGCGSGMGMAMG